MDDLQPIPCDDRLRAQLVQLRREERRSDEPAILDATIVEDAVRLLGPLPDELLAYLAAIGSLGMLLSENEELDAFYRSTDRKDWRAGAELGDALAFDAWGDYPRSYAMYAASDRSFGIFHIKTSTFERCSLSDLLDRRLDLDADPPTVDELAAFVPAIGRVPEVIRRVVHAKFGTGTVVRTLEGKLEIDFGEHGIKILAERFVKDA